MIELLKNDTFWSAFGAIATGASAVAIYYAALQFRFSAWLRAQEIWNAPEFTKHRGIVFARVGKPVEPWEGDEEVAALDVCRKVDEFARLKRYIGTRRLLNVWGDPLAKAWLLLEPVVVQEREKTGWKEKWIEFERIGRKALERRPDLQRKHQQSKTEQR